ncbi:MAG: TIGR01777 family oxidoreductase [Flavobacteriales bacterium]
MQSRVVIAGGSGTVGSYLQKSFVKEGWEVNIISRNGGDAQWNNELSMIHAINGSTMLINLAGKSVQCYFNEKNRNALLTSRVETTSILNRIVANCDRPPQLWLNASGGSIYNENETVAHGEDSPINGTSVMADVARKWEEVFFSESVGDVRKVALRISLVLDRFGGVLPMYSALAKLWLWGKQGRGDQLISWIHVHDFFEICKFILSHESIVGCVNLAAPQVISNSDFMRCIREAHHRSFGFPAPTFALKLAAPIVGFDTELILNHLSIAPKKLLQNGYVFQHETLQSALDDLVV